MIWEDKTEDRKTPFRKNSSAETNLPTVRLALCSEKSRQSTTLNSSAAQARAHTHILNSLLYNIIFSVNFISDYSQPFKFSKVEKHRPSYQRWAGVVMFDRRENTDHWSGRFNDLLLYIHTFLFNSFFGPHPHHLDNHTFAHLWVQSKSKQTADCGWMCVNLKKQGKRHVLLHIVTLIFKE